MDKKYYKTVALSLDELVEIDTDSEQLENTLPFGAEIYQRSEASGPDCFHWRTLRIYHRGTCSDVDLGDTKISHIVKIEHCSHYYRGGHSTIQMKYLKGNETFHFEQNTIGDMADLINIVFAIVTISESLNIEQATTIWRMLTETFRFSDINICLTDITKLRAFWDKIKPKYPFMKKCIAKAIHERVEMLKIKIIEFEIIA